MKSEKQPEVKFTPKYSVAEFKRIWNRFQDCEERVSREEAD